MKLVLSWILSTPIRIKVLVFGLLMSTLPLFVMSLYYYEQAKTDLEKNIMEKQDLVLKSLSREIDLNFSGIFQSIQYATNIRELENDASSYYKLLKQNDSIEEVVITDPKGIVEERVSRYKLNSIEKEESFFSEMMLNEFQSNSKIYGPVEFNQYGQPVMKLVVPLIVNGKKKGLGVIVQLQKTIGEISSLRNEDSSSIYLMDQNRRIIAHQDYRQLWEKGSNVKKDMIFGEVRLKDLQWILVMEQPKKEAYEPIKSMFEKGLLVNLVVTIIVSFISIYGGLFFTEPIILLERAIRSMQSGRYHENIRILRKDEFGRLVHSFNRMRSDLQENSAKLKQEKERLKVVVESIGAGLALVTKEYQITWMNPILQNWIQGDQINIPCYMLFTGDLNPCEYCPISGKNHLFNADQSIKFKSKDGEDKIYRHRVYPLTHAIEAEGEFLIVIEDITEKKQMEEKMIQTDKLSALGLMASSFAHEVNNPLATINVYAEDLLERINFNDANLDEEEMKMYLTKIKANTERCKKITSNLLNFSRKSNWSFASINIKDIISDSLGLVEFLIVKKEIKVQLNIDAQLPEIMADGLKLMQVFVNLLNNSIDSMVKGGILAIDARRCEDNLHLKFSDTGSGITKENLAKVFDPFFTTKPVGQGTGLGLSVCFGIIEQLGGKINISSQVGIGTVVEIIIPLDFTRRRGSNGW